MKHLARQSLLSIKPYQPGKPIEEVKRELGLKDVIKLASNENPYPPAPGVVKAIEKELSQLNRYPDGNCFYLRQALAKKLRVKPEQLIFGNGSDELIVLTVRAFVKPGEEVILAKPSFLIYELASTIEEAVIRSAPLKNFAYDLEVMKRMVTLNTRIVFLGNPDNPSGQYFTRKQLISFLDGLSKDVLVFIDEAYYEYVDEKDYVNSIQLMKTYPNVIVTRTFSKMFGLAGLRIGYGIASAEMIDILNRIREPFNVNSLAQAAALACLKNLSYYKNIGKTVKQKRRYLYQNLERLGLSYVESYTNFVLFKTKEESQTVVRALLKKGVIVRDMTPWGLNEYVRVSIGTEEENKRFIKTLEGIL